jgi:anti-anti-sigma factor
VDASTASAIRAALHKAVVDGHGPLALDLGAVTQLDAVGLGVLMGAYESAHRRGRALTVVEAPRRIAAIFRVAGLARVLRAPAA